jgi:hypothetical protein
MYHYCVSRGFKSTVMSRLQEIFIGVFLWAFSYFVLILFNWNALFSCRSAAAAAHSNSSSCADLSVVAADQSSGFLYASFVYSFLLVLAAMVGRQVCVSVCLCVCVSVCLCVAAAFVPTFTSIVSPRRCCPSQRTLSS